MSEESLTETLRRMLAFRHRGKASGIKAEFLAARLGITPRTLRRAVETLRGEGVPIGGRPATGYFFAQTAEERDDTCRFLYGRAMSSLKKVSRMKRIPLAKAGQELQEQIQMDLEGQ
ncbi:MAG: helix-turn-helix domain-containing protein [Candidatus Glassbacteria bacterium]|nr:helix-turn-helix domain-containing protein [Candidatus Glassbacteria bacterium]